MGRIKDWDGAKAEEETGNYQYKNEWLIIGTKRQETVRYRSNLRILHTTNVGIKVE